MFKFARKNQKKMMAILSAALMVTFLAGYQVSRNSGGGRAERPLGTIGTDKIYAADLSRYANEWRQLLQQPFGRHGTEDIYIDIFARNASGGDRPSLAAGILGDGDIPQIVDGQQYFSNLRAGMAMSREISSNQTAFFLLVYEARKLGFTATTDSVEQVFANSVHNPPTDEVEAESLRMAIADLLIVRQSLDRAADSVKVSQPMVRRTLALQRQSVSLRVALVPASDFLPTAKAPTTQEVQTQYTLLGNRLPNQWTKPADDNPFCFGYAIPDRVQFQFIRLKRSEALDAVKAGKSNQDWANQAFLEFQSRREYYDGMPIPSPTTFPTTLPHGAATQTADTRPSTAPTTAQARKVDDIGQDFVLHRSLVMKDVFDRETEKFMDAVMSKVALQMRTDFTAFHSAQVAKTDVPPSSVGVAYNDKDYIPRLVDTFDAQFKVRLGHLAPEYWHTAADLDQIPGIGLAVVGVSDSPDLGMKFAEYATTRATPFLTDATKASPDALDLWAPSPLMVDMEPETYQLRADYIFRLTAADVAHAPPINEVRQKIEQNLVLASAYAQAKTQAQKIFDRAQTDGLRAAATAAKISVQTTDPIAPLNPRQRPIVAPLVLKPESNVYLAVAAFKLVSAPGDSAHPPMAVVDLYPDATVAIIALDALKPDYTADSENIVQASVRRSLDTELRQQVKFGWLIPKDIATRVGFKATDKTN